MSNGKDMIIHVIAGLIKDLVSMSQYFPKHMSFLEETLMSKLIYLIMQQKLI